MKLWGALGPLSLAKVLIWTATIAKAEGDPALKKRGLCYVYTDHSSADNGIFTVDNSPVSWYYTFGADPAPNRNAHLQQRLEFVPMVHSPSKPDGDIAAIRRLSSGDRPIKHVLVFNEPDGGTEGGGTDTSPEDAAGVWLDKIAPLRSEAKLLLSLPATTGSPRGLQWLRDFNSSCFEKSNRGCEFDFIAAHWYGDFAAAAAWLQQLHELWPDKNVWLTEFAVPAATAEANEGAMSAALAFLDNTTWVERYSWFGAFRKDDANDWTGDGVSLFDNDGGLTGLGAQYMGGNVSGFRPGDKAPAGSGGEDSESLGALTRPDFWIVTGFFLACVIDWSRL